MTEKGISLYPPRTQSSWLGILEDRLPPEFYSALRYLHENGLMTDVVYDIGANSGFFTKIVKRFYPEIRVIGFEPFDFHKPVHDFFGWETCFVGLSNCNEIKEFHIVPEDNEQHRIGGGNSYYKENIEFGKVDYSTKELIQVRRLDDMVEEHSLPQPDLIKIDVQGAELDVIEGAINTIDKAKALMVEVQFVEYNVGAPNYTDVFDKIKQLGFSKIVKIHQTPVDGDFLFLR